MSARVLHRHGGDPGADLTRLGITPRPVVDFSVNVSPLGVPEKIKSAWPALLDSVERYPTVNGKGVLRYYQERFGLRPECVLPGNGSSETIYLALGRLGFRHVAVVSPTFCEYEHALSLAGAEVKQIPIEEASGFAPPKPARLDEALAVSDALVLCNPNNPTGTRFAAQDLIDIASRNPDKVVLVDEAFVQFVDTWEDTSLLSDARIRPNLLVFHSLTKLYAVPGIRLGAVVGHPDTISRLKPHVPPWSVNAVAEAIALLLTDCLGYESAVRDLTATERVRIGKALGNAGGIRLFDTGTNFFLAKWTKTPNLDDLLRLLFEQGLYVRDCRNFPGLEVGFFRFGIRLPLENDLLVSAIKDSDLV